MSVNKKNILLWAFVILGIIASVVLLCFRINAETKSNKAACAVTYDSVLLLANEDNRSPEAWLTDLYAAGIRYLIVTDKNEHQCAEKARQLGYKIGRAGSVPREGDAFLTPNLAPDAVQTPNGFYSEDVPIAVIENPFRTGVIMPEGFDPESTDTPMIKAMYMYNSYSYHYEFKEPATKNENILFGGIFERGLRLVIFTPLYDENEQMVTDISAYADIISGLSERLSERGIKLGDELSVLDAPSFSSWLFIPASLLLVAASVLALGYAVPKACQIQNILLVLGGTASVAGTFIAPDLTQKIWAFGASLLFGCSSAFVLTSCTKKTVGKSLFQQFAVLLTMLLLLGLTGGLYIGALLTSRSYMLGFDIFSGVKLSQIAPIGFAVLWLMYSLYGKKGKKQLQKAKKVPVPVIILVAAAGVCAIAVLLLRTGDNMLPVSDLEIRFRNWLEYSLYVRPRTKEMLAAFPAAALFAAAAKKRCYILLIPLGAFAAIGTASVINTFCHIFTPVLISAVRTFTGAAIGAIIGIAAMYIFSAFLGKDTEQI